MHFKTASMQAVMADTVGFAYAVYQMGLGVLSEHMRTVASFILNGTPSFCHNVNHDKLVARAEANLNQSIAFVQGSSLDIVIQTYIQAVEPSIDPDAFRESFHEMVEYWKRKKISL